MNIFIYFFMFLIMGCYKTNNLGSLKKVNYSVFLDKMENNNIKYVDLEESVKKHVLEHVLEQGNSYGLQTLLNRGMDPDQEVEGGESSLIYLAAQEEFYPALASILIGAGANINHQDSGGRTPMFAAAWKGSEEALQYLLEKNAKLDVEDQVGRTALWIALDRGNKDCAEQLLKEGANPFISKKCGTSTLLIAAKAGYKDIVTDLLKKGVNKKQINIKNEKPVIAAAIGGHKEIVEILKSEDDNQQILDLLLSMDKGSVSVSLGDVLVKAVKDERENDVEALLSLEIKDSNNLEKAISASISQESMNIGRMLLNKCNPRDFKDKGCGFLYLSIRCPNNILLEELLVWGAGPNLPSECEDYIRHPLQDALYYNNKIAAISLLKAGANPNIIETREDYFAQSIKYNKFWDYLNDFEVYQQALDCGLRWDDPDISMEDVFSSLVSNNQVKIIDDLMKKGVKLEEEESDRLVYHHAYECSPEMLKLLLDNNMNIQLSGEGKLDSFFAHPVYKILLHSNRVDRYETLGVILDRCWNVNDVDNKGQTIFEIWPFDHKANRIFISRGIRFKRGGDPMLTASARKTSESFNMDAKKSTIDWLENFGFKTQADNEIDVLIEKGRWDDVIHLIESNDMGCYSVGILPHLIKRFSIKGGDKNKVIKIARYLISMGVKMDYNGSSNPLRICLDENFEEMASIIIEGGANVNTVDNSGQTPLHVAAEKGMASITKLLVKNSDKVNAVDYQGNTPLMVAVRGIIDSDDLFIRQDEIVDILLENKADTRIKNNEGENAAMVAAFCSAKFDRINKKITPFHNKKFIPKLSEESDKEIIDHIMKLKGVYGVEKRLKVEVAVEKGYVDDLDLLLELASDSSDKNRIMNKALYKLSRDKSNKEIVTKLMKRGFFSSYESGDFLVDRILSYAPEMLQDFLDNGLDLSIVNEKGRNCLSELVSEYASRYSSLYDRLRSNEWMGGQQKSLQRIKKKISKLIEGAYSIEINPSSFEDCDDPRLARIFSGKKIESLQDLVWCDNADLNDLNLDNADLDDDLVDRTEFDETLANDFLSKAGDINKQDSRGRNVFFVAAFLGKIEMAKFLAGKGADINTVDVNNMTPLEVAIRSGYEDCAMEILKLGGDPNKGNGVDQLLLLSAFSKVNNDSNDSDDEKRFLFDALVDHLGDNKGMDNKFLKDLAKLNYDAKWNNVLKASLSKGMLDLARKLLNLNCNLISYSSDGQPNIFDFHGEIEELLMLCLDQIEIPDIKLRLELISKALMRGREKLFDRLVEGVDSLVEYNDMRPHPLALAIERNLINAAVKILDLGSDPNICFVGGDENGENPLDLLNWEMYSLLVERGLNLSSSIVREALPMLILRNQVDIVKDLLGKGVMFDGSKGRLGGSIARDLVEFGSIEMIELLSQYGLDMTSYEDNLLSIAACDNSEQVINLLIDRGFNKSDVIQEDWYGIQVQISTIDRFLLRDMKSVFERMIFNIEDKEKLLGSFVEKWLDLYESIKELYIDKIKLKQALEKVRRVISNLIEWTGVSSYDDPRLARVFLGKKIES